MRTDQWLIVTVIALMMAAFIWGRYRYDIVAAVALIVSMVLGLVPPNKAFSGFSDDIVIIVGSALLLSGAIARNPVTDPNPLAVFGSAFIVRISSTQLTFALAQIRE